MSDTNLFGQEQWARRGEAAQGVASLTTQLNALSTRLAVLESYRTKITTSRLTAGSGSTTSTTFVDYPGPKEVTFTKVYASTSIVVQGTVGWYMSVPGANSGWAIRINGVDYEVGVMFFNTANVHSLLPGVSNVITGLAAGVHTGRIRWAVAGGTANTDSNDSVLVSVTEF